jgi:hypothetical protein
MAPLRFEPKTNTLKVYIALSDYAATYGGQEVSFVGQCQLSTHQMAITKKSLVIDDQA